MRIHFFLFLLSHLRCQNPLHSEDLICSVDKLFWCCFASSKLCNIYTNYIPYLVGIIFILNDFMIIGYYYIYTGPPEAFHVQFSPEWPAVLPNCSLFARLNSYLQNIPRTNLNFSYINFANNSFC